MKVNVKAQTIQHAKETVLVLGVFQCAPDQPKISGVLKEHSDVLKKLAEQKVFSGAAQSRYFVCSVDKKIPDLLFIGLGDPTPTTMEDFRIAGAKIYSVLNGEKITSAALDLDSFLQAKGSKNVRDEDFLLALMEGLFLSDYSFDKYLSKKREVFLQNINLYSSKKNSKAGQIVERAEITAETINIARDLSNEPGNILVPMEFAKRAQKFAKEYGLHCKVLGMSELKKEKMGALIGVGQGSTNPPCFIVIEYKPKKPKRGAKKIALVGKAVTFDSGGISLKPGAQMDEMKHDMSGGANIFAAVLLAAKLGAPNFVSAYIAAAENMPDGNAIVPSTILHTRSGKTIEVLNTDAEGRLILADALDYAQDGKPDAVIDMATLTGAVLVALGNVASGIMGNDPGLIEKFKQAADKSEEKHWELPLYKEYTEDMKGKVGDLKNIGSNRDAGSSKGGAFLLAFIRPKMKWMHIDCAGTAWNQRHLPYTQHGATGHGVRTLLEFILDY